MLAMQSNIPNFLLDVFPRFFFRAVEDQILFILRSRFEQCAIYHGDDVHLCDPIRKIYDDAAVAWFIKCEYVFMMKITDKLNIIQSNLSLEQLWFRLFLISKTIVPSHILYKNLYQVYFFSITTFKF